MATTETVGEAVAQQGFVYEVPVFLQGSDHTVVILDRERALTTEPVQDLQPKIMRGLSAQRISSPSIPGRQESSARLPLALLPMRKLSTSTNGRNLSTATIGRTTLKQKQSMNSLMIKSGLII